jgi:DNA replication protein DnaC
MTWARTNSPEFAEKCSLPELRKFAATYHPQDNSAVASGLTGIGKTTALVALANRALDEARELGNLDHWIVRACWATAHDLASARREHRLGCGEAPLIAAAKRASVLFLDELGFEPPSEIAFEVIDLRYRAGLPTLVTTGLRIDPDPSGQSLRQKYGDALVRRLLERGSRLEGWKRG